MRVQLVFLGLLLLQTVALCAVIIVLVDVATKTFRLEPPLALCVAVLMLGVLGYLSFWIAYWNYPALRIVKVALIALMVIRLVLMVRQRRLKAQLAWLGEPMLYVFLFFLAVVAFGFSNGGIEDAATTAQNRFTHPLPPDDVIPFLFAVGLNGDHVPSPLLGDWLASDRPPLQTGLYLLLNPRNFVLVYEIVSSWLQATFLFGVWMLCVAAELPVTARRLALLACCLLPVTILNTFYTWPKIISVGYLLMIFALLFVYRPREPREHVIVGVLLGGLTALAMLCHGSSAFALIGVAVIVLVAWRWPSWRTIAYAVPTLLVLYLPWAAYQAFVDPPGNRLLKWHLADVQDVDSRGLLETMRAAYAALSWHDYLEGRLANFAVQLGRGTQHLRDLALLTVNHDPELARALRIGDFFNFLPSLHGFALALVVALVLLAFMRAWPRQRAIALALLGVVLVTCITCCILLLRPGAAVNHQMTYAMHVMATLAAFIVLGLRAPRVGLLFVALQIVTVGTLYGLTLAYDHVFWPMLVLSIVAPAGLLAFTLAPFLRLAGAARAAR